MQDLNKAGYLQLNNGIFTAERQRDCFFLCDLFALSKAGGDKLIEIIRSNVTAQVEISTSA